jgi:hypothetical protein
MFEILVACFSFTLYFMISPGLNLFKTRGY